MAEVILQIAGTLFPEWSPGSVPVQFDLTVGGGPLSFRLTAERAVSLDDIWTALGKEIYDLIGVHLPTIPDGPWKVVLDQHVQPTLWIGPRPGAGGGYSAYLELLLTDVHGVPTPLRIGGTETWGPVTISLEPDIAIVGLYLGHDAAAGGLDVRAKLETPTTKGKSLTAGASPDLGAKQQMVSFPFPLPSQNSVKVFELIYFGLGQRVGPDPVGPNSPDPMAAIFEQLKTELSANDPKTVLTHVAKRFYKPDRDWFIAAELGLRNFNLKLLFNDPAMYGLEITAAPTSPPGFFDGLLFEILYQKLGPNLGVYYGALDLPYTMRRIPMEGFILILPGFSVWIYTNGDFRINVGWPVGPNSIGIQIDVLIGYAGFYFAKLRTGDNPGAKSSVTYNPILEFGIGIEVVCQESINASIFSATMSVTLAASLQGLLAWRGSDSGYGSLSGVPDAYWFAGSASIAVLLQGSVDFYILKASVTVAFNAAVSFAIENGYTTVIAASAYVSVEVSVHIVFFTIHLSFHTSISHTFTIGSGPDASVDGPLAEGLQFGAADPSIAIARAHSARAMDLLLTLPRLAPEPLFARGLPPRFQAAALAPAGQPEAAVGSPPPAPAFTGVELYFTLQPTAVYETSPASPAYVAMLVANCPAPGAPPLASPGAATDFELLVVRLVEWMLSTPSVVSPSADTLSQQLADVAAGLGGGALPPGPAFGGSIEGFGDLLLGFLQAEVPFRIVGVDNASPPPLATAAAIPMFADLVLTTPNGVVDFNTYDPTPRAYDEALNIYFADMGLVGQSPTSDPNAEEEVAAAASPGPSLASLLFADYFLLLCRYAINTLLDAARAYEKAQTQAYVADTADLDHDRAAMTTHARRAQAAMAPADELATLLETFDYAGAAGVGSRFLMHGLQLPDPAQTPLDPTPQNMAGVPTGGLYALTGQQFADSAASGAVTATLGAGSGAPAGWLSFGPGGSPASAQASTPAQALKPEPAPNWIVETGASPSATGPWDINIRALPPLTSGPFSVNLKNQVTWTSGSPTQALFPLPAAITDRVPAAGARLLLSDRKGAASPNPIAGQGALLIRLTAAQVQRAAAADVAAGSPVAAAGSPATGSATYAPFVYELTGADEATRDLIYQALQSDLGGATISVLYAPPGAEGMQSDTDPSLVLLRSNLSTENQVVQTSGIQAQRYLRQAAVSPSQNFASGTDVLQFLQLLWELSVVNAPGYYLYYRTQAGAGLPAELFADSAPVSASPSAGSPESGTRAPTPGTSGAAADLIILVQLAGGGSPEPTIPGYANTLVATPPPGALMSAEVLDGAGQPLPAYAPTYAAGTGGFEIDWSPVAGSPSAGSPSDTDDSIYQLIQYGVVDEGAFSGSVWSLPIGPEGGQAWQYRQVLPLTAFMSSGSPQPNRYEVIAQPWTLRFRLADVYGNAIPDTFQTAFQTLYNDPLIPPTAWPGADIRYAFELLDLDDPTSGPALVLELRFDADDLVPDAGSPGGSSVAARWAAIQAQYALIADQLADPQTEWSVVTSLIGEQPLAVDPRPTLAGFVDRIRTAIDEIVDPGAARAIASPHEPIAIEVRWPIDVAQVVAQPDDVVAIDVSIAAQRPEALVAPDTLAKAPNTQRIVSPVTVRINPTGGATPSPGSSNSLAAFAALFETAFHDFDGKQGRIKLAQRSGATADLTAAASLWAVRFSEACGFDFKFDHKVATFALRPLNTSPISRQDASGRVHADVDLDAWAQDFLRALDAFLSAETCAAIAVLDEQAGSNQLDRLLEVKSALAAAIPAGLDLVLQDEACSGDLATAKAALQQSLLNTLASAYTVSTIVQASADVTVTGNPDDTSPVLAPPELFGALVSAAAASPPAPSTPYTLSSSPLPLANGKQWLTSLLTVAQPEDLATVTAELEFAVSYMQHDIDTAEAHDGFVPSSWIKFAIPGDETLVRRVSAKHAPTVIPVPLPFKPPIPVLKSQIAVAAQMPASPKSIEAEITEALSWDYDVALSVDLASQDELFFDITYNSQPAPAGLRMGMVEPNVDQLFDRLADFLAAYPDIAPRIPEIAAAAFGQGPPGSPGAAQTLIAEFLALSQDVAGAWPTWALDGDDARLGLGPEVIDNFYLDYGPGQKTAYGVCLYARSASPGGAGVSPGPAPPSAWPTLTFALKNPVGSQIWTPDPQAAQLVDGWWRVSLDLPKSEPDFTTLSLTVGGLNVANRQSGEFETWVVRNADIGGDLPTNPAFVYVSASAKFPDRAIPLIRRPSLQKIAPQQALPVILDEILLPLAEFGETFQPLVRIEASYGFALGQGAMAASAPILLAEGIELSLHRASPGGVAQAAADQIADWFFSKPRTTRGGRLDLSITLFGLVAGRRLPLVQLLKVPLMLPAKDIDAWMRGSGP